ncbi:diaminopimelate epimerase [Urechidicola sp. KH5]
MNIQFYKYQGTGNDFVMIDNRNEKFPKENKSLVAAMCDRRFGVGADGLILLDNSDSADFKMVYFNADGSESTMCGNGGRCLVAFAKHMGVIVAETTFDAVDGVHFASIDNGIVSLQMIDVNTVETHKNHFFLDTGSPHHVEIVENLAQYDVLTNGKRIREGSPYFEVGSNVNFVELLTESKIKVRTFERGVENETLSCGTGVTASAIALNYAKIVSSNSIDIEVEGGELNVSFKYDNGNYSKVFLKGPATFVFEGEFSY